MKYILFIITFCIFLMAGCSGNHSYHEKREEAKDITIDTTLEPPVIQPYEKVINKTSLYPVDNGTGAGFINSKGELVTDFIYSETNFFKDRRSLVETKDGLYGYADISGNLVIDGQYYDARDFSEGLAAVKNQSDCWGFINRKGEVVIKFIYEETEDFHNGIALVKERGHNNACFINTKNEMIPTPESSYSDARYYNEGIIAYDNKFYNVLTQEYIEVDTNGKNFEIRDNFSGGFGIIAENNDGKDEFYYVNKDGELLNRAFDKVYPFKEGLAIGVKDGRSYCIDTEGKTVFERDGVYGTFHEGLVTFESNYKIGFLNRKGNIVIPPIYGRCEHAFDNGIAVLELDYSLRYINRNNETIFHIGDGNARIPIPYPQPTIDEIQSVLQDDGTYISEDGQFKYEFSYPKEVHVGDKFELTGITANDTEIDSVVGYIGCVIEDDESKLSLHIPENFDEYESAEYMDGWNLHSITQHGITEYTREYTAISAGTAVVSAKWYMQIETENGFKCYNCHIDCSISILP